MAMIVSSIWSICVCLELCLLFVLCVRPMSTSRGAWEADGAGVPGAGKPAGQLPSPRRGRPLRSFGDCQWEMESGSATMHLPDAAGGRLLWHRSGDRWRPEAGVAVAGYWWLPALAGA